MFLKPYNNYHDFCSNSYIKPPYSTTTFVQRIYTLWNIDLIMVFNRFLVAKMFHAAPHQIKTLITTQSGSKISNHLQYHLINSHVYVLGWIMSFTATNFGAKITSWSSFRSHSPRDTWGKRTIKNHDKMQATTFILP